MSDNKKTPLEEAKISFEEIQKFAKEQAAAQLEEQVTEKLMHIFDKQLNEEITINISGDGVEVSKDGEVVSTISDVEPENIEGGNIGDTDLDDSEFTVSDDEDEIKVDDESIDEIIQNDNMENMNTMKMEQAPAAPVDAAPIDAAPVDAAAPAAPGAIPAEGGAPDMNELLSKIDTLINVLMQKEGGEVAPEGMPAPGEGDVQVVDDEQQGAAPAPAAPGAPVQEEEFEITDFEDQKPIDEMEEEMLEIVDEDTMPMEEDTMDEMLGVGQNLRRSNRLGKLPRQGVENRKDIKENKAQNESKIDELIKENSGLKNSVKELNKERKEFEEAFVGLRTQFNEMQLFNGKLALVNKVLMNGGLTTEEKIKICEQFDNVKTYEEASKLFKNIIKENNIKVGDGKEKLKSAPTNTAKPKSTSEPLYESDEARRAKRLAGIIKSEDEE